MVSPGSGGKRELKRNKDGGERIKLLPQTAWSDYFFFQNMQAYIWFVGLPAVPSGVRFQKTAGVVDADVLCRAEVVYGMDRKPAVQMKRLPCMPAPGRPGREHLGKSLERMCERLGMRPENRQKAFRI